MAAKAQFASEQSNSGDFVRQNDAFRDWVSADGSTEYPAAAGRYHLYVSLACPWASRTMIARHLRGLEQTVGLTVVDPVRDERGWAFRDGPGYSTDTVNGFNFLKEAYVATASPASANRSAICSPTKLRRSRRCSRITSTRRSTTAFTAPASARASSRAIGGSFAPSLGSTRSITFTSSATSGAFSISRISRVT